VVRRGASVLASRAAAQTSQRSAYEELQTFSGVLNHIRINYPDSVSYSELVAAAIRGVLRSLVPTATTFRGWNFQRSTALEHGELVSVGIALEEVDGVATVLAVAPRSPAAKAASSRGDRLVTLNDTSGVGPRMRTLELRLARQKGSKVRLPAGAWAPVELTLSA